MNASQNPVALVNIFTVEPVDQQELVALLRQNTETVIRTLKGWIATELIASRDGRHVAIHSQWETPADVEAMRADARMQAYFPRIAALARLESIIGDSVYAHRR